MRITATHITVDPRDELAWKAICEWPSRSNINFSDYTDDYAELTRWFLWDKVGRAIRFSSDSQSFALERKLFEVSNCLPGTSTFTSSFDRTRLTTQLSSFFSFFRKKPEQQIQHVSDFIRRKGPLVYVPVLSGRLKNAAGELIRENMCQVATGYCETIEGAAVFRPNVTVHPDDDVTMMLYNAIIDGLKGFDITLMSCDKAMLRTQISTLTSHVKYVRAELETLEPDAIIVHGDNHPPFQAYVLSARKMGIPVIMLQHGLDCEHRYLDEAYASNIAVWGGERLTRYRNKSIWQPHISVTGNPEYDCLRPPSKIDPAGNYWLWLTRPHTPEKCYAPSRTPDEGLALFYALIDAVKKSPGSRLVIKAHPYDYAALYGRLILEQGLHDVVEISGQTVQELVPHASLIITEDSSAGLDALFAGKPVVHAHFVESAPVIPFVEYGAALPGFTKEQLVESILRISAFDYEQAQGFLAGQVQFIRDFAGLCDGNAGKRFVQYVSEIICQK